jgi:signal peptidase II
MSPYLRIGLIAALGAAVIDQAVKLWLLHGLDIATLGSVRLAPFFDIVLAWNTGISYGWFQNDGEATRLILIAVKVAAVIGLGVWLLRAQTRIAALGLGLIIGGALGNGIDRALYGAVMDFAFFHVEIGGKAFNWYVFNLADVAIVAGVAALLYDSVVGLPAAKAP